MVPTQITRLPAAESVRSIFASNAHSLCVLEGGAVYGWGFGHDGRLGLGQPLQLARSQLVPKQLSPCTRVWHPDELPQVSPVEAGPSAET